MRRRLVLAAAALCLPVAVAGCSDETVSPSPSPTPDPAAVLAKAKSVLDEAKGVTLDLSSSIEIPRGSSGVSAAKGNGIIDAVTPKFKGTVSATVTGTPATVDMVAIGDRTWMSLFTPNLVPVDLEDLGAPNPGKLFAPGTGLSSLLTKATGAALGKEARLGKEVLQTYTATIPGSVIQDLLRLGTPKDTFAADFGILPATGELRQAKVTGPFYEGVSSTYTVVLTDYGKTVDIQQP